MTRVSKSCPDCGGPVAPGKRCAACLLGVGLESLSREPGEARFEWTPPTVAELAGRFPELEILRFVGRGGMGAVYQARQKSLDRLVAVKILPPEIGRQPAFAERFAREAQAMARLNHPNIVTIYEFGERQGGFFFMMEYVDGVTLRQLLGGERVSPREALAIVPQICDALQYAHDQGIVHRDIKPENILLDRQGRVKVADFGLAKLMAAAESEAPAQTSAIDSSATVTAVGTPSYMAPEQAEQPGKVDHRADIYALGVVFYQMLTGELPGKQIVPPSQRVQVDVRLDQVVLRALERKPELRYSQVSEVKILVETIAQGVPDRPAAAPATPSRRWAGWRWGAAGILLLLAIAGGVWGLKHLKTAGPQDVDTVLSTYKRPPELHFRATAEKLNSPRRVMEAFLWCSLAGDVDGLAELFWLPDATSRRDLKAWLRKTENRYRMECLQDLHWMPQGEIILTYQSGNQVYRPKFIKEKGRFYIVDDKLPIRGIVKYPNGSAFSPEDSRDPTIGEGYCCTSEKRDDAIKTPLPKDMASLPYLSSEFHLVELAEKASPIRAGKVRPWEGAWLAQLPDGNQCYCRFKGNEQLLVGILPAELKVSGEQDPLVDSRVVCPDKYPARWFVLPTQNPNQWFAYDTGAVFDHNGSHENSTYKSFALCNQFTIQDNCLQWGSNKGASPLVFKRIFLPYETTHTSDTLTEKESVRWLGWFDLPGKASPTPVVHQFFRDGTAKTIYPADGALTYQRFHYESRNRWLFLDISYSECVHGKLILGDSCRFFSSENNGRAMVYWSKEDNPIPFSQKTDLWLLPEDSDGGILGFQMGGISGGNAAWDTEMSVTLAKSTYTFTMKKKTEESPYTWELLFQKRNDMAIPEWGNMKIRLQLNGKPLPLSSSDEQWYSPPAAGPLEKRQVHQTQRWGLAENQCQPFDAGFPVEGLLEGVKMPEDLDPLRDRITYALSYMPPRQIDPVPRDPPLGRSTTDCWMSLPIPWRTPAETKAQAEKVKAKIHSPSTTIII